MNRRARRQPFRPSRAFALEAGLAVALVGLMLAAPWHASADSPMPSPFSPHARTADQLEANAPGAMMVHDLLSLPHNAADPSAYARAIFGQLEHQGVLPRGLTQQLSALGENDDVERQPASSSSDEGRRGPPPSHVFQDAYPTCDLDGDGISDLVINKLEPFNRWSIDPSYARVEARSGTNNSLLWDHDNLVYTKPSTGSLEYDRGSEANWMPPGNVHPHLDLNADGVCDTILIGWDSETDLREPFFNSVSLGRTMVRLAAISGVDGEFIWERIVEAGSQNAQEPIFGTAAIGRVENLPTGFLVADGPDGPRIFLKTTDVQDRLVQESIVTRFAGTFGDGFYSEDVRANERIHYIDARDGNTVWVRDLLSDQDGKTTTVTWMTATVDLTEDDEPDILLEQLRDTNPRGSTVDLPVTGERYVHYGRGVRVLTLDGSADGQGADIWAKDIVDHEVARAKPGFEEGFETIVWTHAQALPDITGDDISEILVRYLVAEEGLASGSLGDFRTYVLPVDGFDGDILWQHKVQGWAVVEPIGIAADGPVLAIGSTDVNVMGMAGAGSATTFSGRNRVEAVRATDGEGLWSHAQVPMELSGVMYTLTLDQFEKALAPVDLDGDGVRDVLTPGRARGTDGIQQALLATQSHDYGFLDASDGTELGAIGTWGGVGEAITCGPGADQIVVVSGNARRIQMTRFDLENGTVSWEKTLFNDPAPRAATTGISLAGLTSRCVDHPDGSMFLSMTLGRASSERGYEVIGVYGSYDAATGDAYWQAPETYREPGPSIFTTPFATLHAQRAIAWSDASLWIAAGLGVLAGVAGVILSRIIRARRARQGLKGAALVGIVLLFASAPFMGPAAQAFDDGRYAFEDGAEAIVAQDADPAATHFHTTAADSVAANVPSWVQDLPPRDGTPWKDWQQHVGSMDDFASRSMEDRIQGVDEFFRQEFSFAYTYAAPDIDGDGQQDIIVDMYCLYQKSFTCNRGVDANLYEDPAGFAEEFLLAYTCSVHHILFGVSGRTGEILWNLRMDQAPEIHYSWAGCQWEYVIGTVPLPRGDVGILAYRFREEVPLLLNTLEMAWHTLYMVSARTGEIIWEREFEGFRHVDYAVHSIGRDQVINPIIRPYEHTRDDGTIEANAAIFVQFVGWEIVTDTDLLQFGPALLGYSYIPLVDTYQPTERLARLDPLTGETVWEQDTFLPQQGLSTLPMLWDAQLEWDWWDLSDIVPNKKDDLYWRSNICCGDITGDGVPDPMYRSYSWANLPVANLAGPYRFTSGLVAFDGASGARHFDIVLDADLEVNGPRPFSWSNQFERPPAQAFGHRILPMHLGDVDTDGRDDIMVHTVFGRSAELQRTSVISGATGATIWEDTRDLVGTAIPMGDVDGDGAPDIAMVEWFAYDEMQRVLPREHEIRILSGANGLEIRRVTTQTAPVDIAQQMAGHRLTGVPDVDGDGIMDFLVDDPIYLDDQTAVHRMTVRSGADDEPLWSMDTVGTFAHPVRAPDLDGDGLDELALVSGDINDLWLTAYRASDGEAMWSRRLIAEPISSYVEAIPLVAIDSSWNDTRGANDVLVTFHLHRQLAYISTSLFFCIGCDETYSSSTSLRLDDDVQSQTQLINGTMGALYWDSPGILEPEQTLTVRGPTPATQIFHAWYADQQQPLASQAAEATVERMPEIGAFLAAALLGAAASGLVIWWRGRDSDLPDLDLDL